MCEIDEPLSIHSRQRARNIAQLHEVDDNEEIIINEHDPYNEIYAEGKD
jgi:hypothetical protein